MTIIAMIPARLGSKRIPKKNIRYFGDKPLLQYPIDLARDSGLFDEIWVTAAETELKPFVERCGANFHTRPAEHSDDNATNKGFTYDFLRHHECNYVIMINTTSPLLRIDTLRHFIEVVTNTDKDVIVSVVQDKAESFFREKPLNFDIHKKVNSQNLIPVWKIVWALTAWKREPFIQRYEMGLEPVFGLGSIVTFEVPKDESCDLDTPEDWAIAEGVLESRKYAKEPRYYDL